MEEKSYPLQYETGEIIGVAYEVKKILGSGLLEIVYKDAFEFEFKNKGIIYEREKEYNVVYKNVVLPHKFYADFVVFDKVILEVKAKMTELTDQDIAQTLNYLRLSGCQIGLLINFSKERFQIKRVIL